MNGLFYLSYFFCLEELAPYEHPHFGEEECEREAALVYLLGKRERNEVISLFLNRLSHCINELENPTFTSNVDILERVVGEDPESLCRFGELLFLNGLKNDDSLLLLQAYEKFDRASAKYPLFFNDPHGSWWTLFGHLLLYLGESTSDLLYIHQSIEKYQKAVDLLEERQTAASEKYEEALSKEYLRNKTFLEKLYWYQGFSWTILSKYAEEPYDLTKGLNCYERAAELGCADNSFWIHYGRALVILGDQLHRIEHLHKGLNIFKKVISNSYPPLEESGFIEEESFDPMTLRFRNHLNLADPFAEVWLQAILTAKKIYEYTHLRSDFLEAHDLFEKASQAIADKESSLWLHWGDLFLKASTLMGKLPFAEIALEKFTSPKLKNCDHLLATSFMTESLVLIGFHLENYRIIREADKRALPLLQAAKDYPETWVTNGLSQMSLGAYLSDERYLFNALDNFSKALECDSQSVYGWHGVFLTYLALGELKKDKEYFFKAQNALSRVLELRPLGAYFWYEYALLLFKLRDLEEDIDTIINILEDALDKFEIALNLTGGWETTLESGWLYPYACTFFLLGDLLGEEGYYQQSLEVLRKLFDDDSEFPYIHFQFGVNYLRLGEISGDRELLKLGIDHLEKNIEIDPEDAPGFGELGYGYLILSEWTDSSLDPDSSREFKEKSERYLLIGARIGYEDAYYYLACLYSLMDRIDLSLHFIKRAEKSRLISSFDDLLYDDWLDNLRQSRLFQDFLENQNRP